MKLACPIVNVALKFCGIVSVSWYLFVPVVCVCAFVDAVLYLCRFVVIKLFVWLIKTG